MNDTSHCLTCDLIARRDRGEAPLWDSILRAASWDLVHSYNTALPGWLVLVARRHVEAIDELMANEAAELDWFIDAMNSSPAPFPGSVTESPARPSGALHAE